MPPLRFSITYCNLIFANLWLCLAADATSACSSLSSVLPARVFIRGSNAYNSSINSYTYVNERLLPACIISPESTTDVSASVEVLGKNADVHFAIRGGGHSSNTNFSNVADGVTIDMRAIKTVTVDGAESVVKVGAGALWKDVYAVTDPRNISVLGGRIATVGVGGLTSGGGISYFSPSQGWVCDGVVNFEVVLASGQIVNANAASNRDLFSALKGGQNNFGVITRFDLNSFPQTPFWGGTITYTNSTDGDLLRAFSKFKSPEGHDPLMSVVQNMAYDSGQKAFAGVSAVYYTTSEPVVDPEQVHFYTDIEPQLTNTLRLSMPGEFAQELEDMVVPDEYTVAATTSFPWTPTVVTETHELWKEWVLKIGNIANISVLLNYQSVPPPPRNISLPNSLGFSVSATPEKDLVAFTLGINYHDPGVTEALTREIDAFINKIDAPKSFKYMNYAGWFQDPIAAYGEDQVRKLRKVSAKYDPEAMFQKQVIGGYKLW